MGNDLNRNWYHGFMNIERSRPREESINGVFVQYKNLSCRVEGDYIFNYFVADYVERR